MKKVVFIILNYRTYEDTIRQVTELVEEDRRDIQIIIVDNCSPNESYEKLRDIFKENDLVDVIQTSNNWGFAKGNNYGLKYASKYTPEFVCVINNDVHFSLETIDALCNIYVKLDSPAVISPIQMLPDNKIARFKELRVPSFWRYVRDYTFLFSNPQHKYVSNTTFGNVQKVEWIPGAFMFTKYNTFKSIEFFDEDTFLYGEESLLAGKIKKEGLNNYIILDQQYIHEHSKTISTVLSVKRQSKLIFQGKKIFLKKYSPSLIWLKIPVLYISYRFNLMCQIIINAISKA